MEISKDIYNTEPVPEGSIAVLPFKNLSSDRENEYFSDGITEELINALTKVEGLNVIARSSAFAFKEKEIDPKEVRNKLGVGYILEGSVRKAGNRVRVTAQLIKTSDCFNLFSEVYDRELKDIFEVQDDISNKIVQKFKAIIGIPDSNSKLAPSLTNDIDAYELYLKGRFNLGKGSLEATNAAIQYFEAALKKDKNFVLAVTGLAACYTFLGGSGLMDVAPAFEKVRVFAGQANSIDPGVAETHLALANCSFWCDWDFSSTGSSVKQAIRLNPGTSSIHGFYSLYLMASGNLEEALIEAKLAIKLDPLSLKMKFQLGELYYRSEKYVEAIDLFDEILSENRYFKQASVFKGWCHLFLDEPVQAEDIFKSIPIAGDKSMVFSGGLAMIYHKNKQYDKILNCLKAYNAEVETGNRHWLNYNYTLIFRALGEHDKMFQHLQKCLNEKDTPLVFINVDPLWTEFRNDPTFSKLIEHTFIPENRDHFMILKSDTRENLRLNLRNLLYIEAQENYSMVVWSEGDAVHEKLLRVTLKNIEDQINDPDVIRCHRSFIINTRAKFKILGNSNGYQLKSGLLKKNIPVSRSLGKKIVAKIRDRE